MKTNTSPARFHLTFDTVTEASAAHGDSARRGFLPKSGQVPARSNQPKNPAKFTLKRAVEILREHGDRFEADSCPCEVARWVTATPPDSVFQETGEVSQISLHLPRELSPASARRVTLALARELRVYGVKL